MVSTLMLKKKKKMIAMNVDIDEIFENIDGSLEEEEGFWDGLEFGPIPGDPFFELPHVDIDKTFLLHPFDDGISTSQSPSPNSVLQCELPKICKTRKRRTKRRQRRSPWPGVPHSIGSTSKKTKQKKKKKLFNLSNISSDNKEIRASLQPVKKCTHCEITQTPQWRAGPMGPKTLCNACGVRYRSGRLFPEYRPAASPTFVPCLHSNSHRKVLEMRNKRSTEAMADDVDCHATSAPLEYDHATSAPLEYDHATSASLGYDRATSAPPEFVPMNSNLLDDI